MSDFTEHRRLALERQNREKEEAHRKRTRNRKKKERKFYLFTFLLLLCGIALAVVFSVCFPSVQGEKTSSSPVSAKAKQDLSAKAVWTAAGDIVFHKPFLDSGVYHHAESNTYEYSSIFDYSRPLLAQADFSTVTMETALAGDEAGYSGYPLFRSPDALADALSDGGFSMVNLASNHVYDGMDSGLLRTMDVLKQKNLLFTGTRPSQEEKHYTVVEVNGIKIGVISYVYETTEEDGSKSINGIPLSSKAAPLVNSFNPNDPDTFYEEVQTALSAMKKEKVQYTIAYMHWGTEYQTQNSQEQADIAQHLCNLGIDTLIGSHPHVIQPVDVLTSSDGSHKMLCAYAVGNFLSNQRSEYMQNEMPTGETEDSYLLTLTLSRNKKGKVSLTDVTFTPMWTYRRETDNGAAFVVLPVNDTDSLEKETGLSGIKEEADASAARTYSIIKEGTKKVKSSLPISSAI